MASKITCYLDCTSMYSYYAFTYIRKQRPVLSSHNVTLEFVPVFLGGIMAGTGNKPPWMVPQKAVYGDMDRRYANRFFGLPRVEKPSVFPIMSIKPQRGMCYIKDHFPLDKYEEAMRLLYVAFWELDIDISQVPLLSSTWAGIFAPDELKAILEATDSPEYKKKLSDNTAEAMKLGAYGAPWFMVRNKKGEESPFFGSDRFHFMFQFLDLPVREMAIEMGPGGSKL